MLYSINKKNKKKLIYYYYMLLLELHCPEEWTRLTTNHFHPVNSNNVEIKLRKTSDCLVLNNDLHITK